VLTIGDGFDGRRQKQMVRATGRDAAAKELESKGTGKQRSRTASGAWVPACAVLRRCRGTQGRPLEVGLGRAVPGPLVLHAASDRVL
jgi:hypothetical protein